MVYINIYFICNLPRIYIYNIIRDFLLFYIYIYLPFLYRYIYFLDLLCFFKWF